MRASCPDSAGNPWEFLVARPISFLNLVLANWEIENLYPSLINLTYCDQNSLIELSNLSEYF